MGAYPSLAGQDEHGGVIRGEFQHAILQLAVPDAFDRARELDGARDGGGVVVDGHQHGAAVREAAANGADRIGIVTSGRCLSREDVDNVCDALRAMRQATDIGLCASLKLLTEDDLAKLKAAGLQRVHCNIETAPSHFPALCTTHTFAEKLATLRAAKRLGFQICCGGIIGMGETDEQLVEFAFTLREIAPDSIPVNVLHPIEGTPLADRGILDPERVVDSVAILRLVNPSTPLRFAGGRRDETAAKCIYVGMSAGIAGPLLTTPGADFDDDRELALRAGYAVGGKK